MCKKWTVIPHTDEGCLIKFSNGQCSGDYVEKDFANRIVRIHNRDILVLGSQYDERLIELAKIKNENNRMKRQIGKLEVMLRAIIETP